MEENFNKNKIEEFIYFTQFQKKLPLIYFFLTKEFIIWAVIMYVLSFFFNPLIFSFILLLSFMYVIREYFHYKVIEKYELPLFKKFREFLFERKLDN